MQHLIAQLPIQHVMRIAIFTIFLLFSIFTFSQSNHLSAPVFIFPDNAYELHSWQSFYLLTEIHDTIDIYNPSLSLLSAAVFYATSKVRYHKGLREFTFSPELRNMAAQHSKAMATYDFVDHFNLHQPKFRTMNKRSNHFHANAEAENVASEFLYRYDTGTNFYRVWTGKSYSFYTDEGLPIQQHTYLSFAESLVQNWMNSPGHRKAILNRNYFTLGCAVELPKLSGREGFIPLAFSTQNFGK